MKYRITHSTRYEYVDAVSVGHNEVIVTPRNYHNQMCLFHRIAITPQPSVQKRRMDYFGNQVTCFSFNEGYSVLTVRASSRVQLTPIELPSASQTVAWDQVAQRLRQSLEPQDLDARQFQFESPRVPRNELFANYARQDFLPGRPILEALLALNERFHREFEFNPSATTVNTPVAEVLEKRSGVCQDFAHVFSSMMRSLGLPVRYVSGYLRTIPPAGRPRMVGADASHAWVSVYCGKHGWIDVDPTNNMLPSMDHVTVAWGRDYDDVCPVKGVYIGGGKHTMKVSVDVEPLDG